MIGEGTSYEDLTYTVQLNNEEYGVAFRPEIFFRLNLICFLFLNNYYLTILAVRIGSAQCGSYFVYKGHAGKGHAGCRHYRI